MGEKKKFYIWVEVCKVNSKRFFRREYDVMAETREDAEREALFIAKEEWFDANLVPRSLGR